jgi:hypothetical protein
MFSTRPPSVAWEPVSLPDAPGQAAWVWFRPAHAPDGLVLQIPEETRRAVAGGLTMRRALAAAGVHPAEVAGWSLRGATYDAQGGANPLLDQPLPPLPAEDADILVRIRAMPPPGPAGFALAGGFSELFAAIEADWNAILQIETNLAMARQQLNGLGARLHSLNRELSPDERVASDSLDKRDWHDARRWLRDGISQVARLLRDHDIGVTSAAGMRNRFEQIYADFVVPRRPFEDLPRAQREFEAHRKMVQHLLSGMQQTLTNTSRDGEQRAQQILTRIAGKVRTNRTKR